METHWMNLNHEKKGNMLDDFASTHAQSVNHISLNKKGWPSYKFIKMLCSHHHNSITMDVLSTYLIEVKHTQ